MNTFKSALYFRYIGVTLPVQKQYLSASTVYEYITVSRHKYTI